jgi:hypothetical protein
VVGLAASCMLLGDRPLHRSWIRAERALGPSASVVWPTSSRTAPLRAGWPLARRMARVATTLGQAAQSHRAFARRPKRSLLTPVARDAVDPTAGVFTTTGYAHRNELATPQSRVPQ